MGFKDNLNKAKHESYAIRMLKHQSAFNFEKKFSMSDQIRITENAWRKVQSIQNFNEHHFYIIWIEMVIEELTLEFDITNCAAALEDYIKNNSNYFY